MDQECEESRHRRRAKENLKGPPITASYDAELIRIYAGSKMHALLSKG
jgi:hypothetical protein